MNKLIIIIIIPLVLLAQKSEAGFGEGEIYLAINGLAENETVNVKMNLISSVWGGGPLVNSGFILNPGQPNYYNLNFNVLDDTVIPPLIITQLPNTNFLSFNWPRTRFIVSDAKYESFGYGLYRISIEEYTAYFYIDYRDESYGNINICYGNNNCSPNINTIDCNDIWIKYEKNNNKFSIMNRDYDIINPGISINHCEWNEIENGQLIKFYELKGRNPVTTNFPQYWQNSLALIDNGNNKPRLVWGPHPNYFQYQISGYKIYYSFHNNGYPPGSFNHLTTVNNTTFDYVHQTLNLGSGDLISYYIKAIIIDEHESTFESSATNTVTAQLDILFKESTDEVNPEELKYFLFQNHPNPFNPVTNIKYQIKEKGFVTIKVFDILGKEIVTLVNDYKEAGEYSVDFSTGSTGDGRSLPSGVYICSIIINDYYQSCKMSLIK